MGFVILGFNASREWTQIDVSSYEHFSVAMKTLHSPTLSAAGSLQLGGKRSQLRPRIARSTGEPNSARPLACSPGNRVVVACVALFLAGCGRWPQSPPIVTTHWDDLVTWSAKNGPGVAGLDYAAVSVHGYDRPKVGETLVAVWVDFHPVDWKHEVQTAPPDAPDTFRADSTIESVGPEKRLEFEVSFHREDAGTLTMFKQRFNLKNGTLFVVSFAKGFPVVQQLKRTMSRAQLTESVLKQVAATDPDVIRFFKGQPPK